MAKINKKELIEFFLMESQDHFESVLNGLLVLEKDPSNWSVIDELFRSAHTIKGSAAMVSFNNIASVAHTLENILDELRKGDLTPDRQLITFLMDFIEELSRKIQVNKDDFSSDYSEKQITRLKTHAYEKDTDKTKTEDQAEEQDVKTVSYEAKATKENTEKEYSESSEWDYSPKRQEILKKADDKYKGSLDTSYADEFIRIRMDKLDSLLNLAGELITNKNRQADRVSNLRNLSLDLDYSKKRLVSIIREFEEKYAYSLNENPGKASEAAIDDFRESEFDRYDDFNIFSRRLSEIGNDIVTVIDDIMSNFTYFSEETAHVNTITNSLQKGLTDIRMIPIDRLFNIALRTLRSSATTENKNVNLKLSGENIEIDKSLIDSLSEVIIHLIRNAVSHGIENAELRRKLGKPEEGTIHLKASRESSIIVFEISDDGGGIDFKKIKQKAVEMGIYEQYDLDNMRWDKLSELVFKPGFSTKISAEDVSGRGVGLDFVKMKVESLGGSVNLETNKGKGTTFILNVPITLLIADYLVVEENSQLFSLSIIAVQESFEIRAENIKKIGRHFFYESRGEKYEIHDLGTLLSQTSEAEFKNIETGIIVEGPRKKYILTVDKLWGRETAVTKKLGTFFDGLKYFVGANISSQGVVRFIIDPVKLMEYKTGDIVYKMSKLDESVDSGINYIPNSVLLVDDSISVRKYLSKLLSDSYYVNEAVDGIDAVGKLESKRFDLIITDLEMPSMNGYELIEHIRDVKGDNLTHIFVLTSRATEKHRNKAMELGANDFIVKPLREQTVMEKIKGVMRERAKI